MAYQTYSISAISDIPPLVASFANLQGWTVDTSTPSQPVFTHPSLGGAVPHKLVKGAGSDGDTLSWFPASGSSPGAQFNVPWINSGGASASPAPTVLHVFCALTPQPHIAIVVEFGFNLYRHLYFGYMEKIGGYTGGEVLGAVTPDLNKFVRSGYLSKSNLYLFNGRSSRQAQNLSGGVHLIHAGNPNPWRTFGNPPHSTVGGFVDTEAYGGFGDDINTPLVQHGKSPFAGVNILTPVNLYAVNSQSGTVGFSPIGRPAAVRMVNLEDLSPGAQITVGSQHWRVFPALSKNPGVAPGNPTSGQFPTYETSHFFGYAYLES